MEVGCGKSGCVFVREFLLREQKINGECFFRRKSRYFGVRRQSEAATALWEFAFIEYDGPSFLVRGSVVDSFALVSKDANPQSGVALRLPPQSKKSKRALARIDAPRLLLN